jgi:pyruvate-ferredoxin/flavodoxin oxidoreductase
VFVHQSSQASPSHLMAGVLRGLNTRRPALFSVYTPCPVEHGLPDDWSQRSARLALESRAFPYLTYDPDAGRAWADCLSLDGNPSVEDAWPTYTLEYVDDSGAARTMELPLTTADWAATEGRFRKHFKRVAGDDDALVPFHEYLARSAGERDGTRPFIHVLGAGRRLERWTVADEIVRLAEERQHYWTQLRELAGVVVSDAARERAGAALEAEREAELEAKLDALRREYEARIAELKAAYPAAIARRLAEGLLGAARGGATIGEFLAALPAPATNGTGVEPRFRGNDEPKATASAPATPPVIPADAGIHPPSPVVPAAPAESADDALVIEPYIESERCTSCNECTNLNKKLFGYNADKQAYIKDPKAGTFAQLVTAAEKCPVGAIHPGTPLNPKEKDLDKWLKRAQAF